MKRDLVPAAMIPGILVLLLTSSVSFAQDWHPLKTRHGNLVVVGRHYVVPSCADPYRCVRMLLEPPLFLELVVFLAPFPEIREEGC